MWYMIYVQYRYLVFSIYYLLFSHIYQITIVISLISIVSIFPSINETMRMWYYVICLFRYHPSHLDPDKENSRNDHGMATTSTWTVARDRSGDSGKIGSMSLGGYHGAPSFLGAWQPQGRGRMGHFTHLFFALFFLFWNEWIKSAMAQSPPNPAQFPSLCAWGVGIKPEFFPDISSWSDLIFKVKLTCKSLQRMPQARWCNTSTSAFGSSGRGWGCLAEF